MYPGSAFVLQCYVPVALSQAVTSRRPGHVGSPPKAQLSSCPSPVVDRRPSYCDWHQLMHAIDLYSIRQMSVFH